MNSTKPHVLICPQCAARYPVIFDRCSTDGARLLRIGGLIGQSLGSYIIVGALGSGGMGTVYRAVHPTIGARVAVKVMHAGEAYQSRTAATRFFNEACAAAKLPHDNIVKVLDFGSLEDGRSFLIMEHLDGAPLSDIIQGFAPLPYHAVASLVEEVLEAVAAVHQGGIIHRDLKPGNLFVTRGMRPILLDFGVAKLRSSSDAIDLTAVGAPVGTPAYMAPEQVLGHQVDQRADLYSIGAVLYHALTGREPFPASAGSGLAVMTMQLESAPVPPRDLYEHIPPELEEVVLKALAKSPDDRFASARMMKSALAAAVGHRPDSRPLLPMPLWPRLDDHDAMLDVEPEPSFFTADTLVDSTRSSLEQTPPA